MLLAQRQETNNNSLVTILAMEGTMVSNAPSARLVGKLGLVQNREGH